MSNQVTDSRRAGAQTLRPSVLVFDVNETLLDIEWLTPLFEKVFGDGRVMREWFAQQILYSNCLTLANLYQPFPTLGLSVLKMVAAIHGKTLSTANEKEFRERMATLPAHADAAAALERLRTAGFRLVTLTNSPESKDGGALQRAGLSPYFERNFSVGQVQRFKPAPEVYRLVAETLALPTAELCLVAAHVWDTIGAQSLGYAGAFVQRTGNAALELREVPQPQITAPDLTSLADRMIARWRKP